MSSLIEFMNLDEKFSYEPMCFFKIPIKYIKQACTVLVLNYSELIMTFDGLMIDKFHEIMSLPDKI